MTVHWFRNAELSVDRIYNHIASDNPQAAKYIRQRIIQAVRQLAKFPEAGRPGEMEGTRELVVTGTPYLVIYRVEKRDVQVLFVYHSARLNPLQYH